MVIIIVTVVGDDDDGGGDGDDDCDSVRYEVSKITLLLFISLTLTKIQNRVKVLFDDCSPAFLSSEI